MKKVRLIPYFLMIIPLLFFTIVKGQDCVVSGGIEEDYERLSQVLKSELPHQVVALADSLIDKLEIEEKTQCTIYHSVLYKKAFALGLLDKNEEALTLSYQLIKDAKATEDWEIVASAYIFIAKIHEIIDRPQDCLRNLKKAHQLIKKHQLNAVFAHFAVRYASYHRIYDNIDSTKVYALKAIEYGKKYKVDKSITDGHLLMGMVTQELEESIYHFQAAANLFYKDKMYLAASSQKGNIAKTYYRANKLQQASIHLDTAFLYNDMIPQTYPKYFDQSEWLYDIKASIAEAQGLLDSAILYLKKSQEAGKNYIIKTNQESINQQEIAFAIEQEQEKLSHERQRITSLIWLVLLLFLSLVIGFSAFINNRQKRKEIATKNEALKKALDFQSILLSEVHHRVKNNLQLVISLLTIRSYKTTDQNMKTQLNDISNKVRSIALIHEQLYQTEVFEKINIQNYFNQLFAYFKTLDSTDKSFTYAVNTNDIELNLETIVPLGIICSELISNSLKYAQPDETLDISIVLTNEKDDFQLKYQDNGVGYPNGELEQKANSMGMLLIKSMVRQLMADYQTFNQNGATFQLTFKEKKVSTV